MNSSLGKNLLEQGYLTSDQLRIASYEQQATDKNLGEILIDLGFIDSSTVAKFIGHDFSCDTVNLQNITVDKDALNLIPKEFAYSHKVIPLALLAGNLQVALTNPNNLLLLDRLENLVRNQSIQIQPVFVLESEIEAYLDKFYGYELSLEGILDELETESLDLKSLESSDSYAQPLVRLVDSILVDAVKRKASDIHLEPEEFFFRVRYRLDGVLQEIKLLHKFIWPGVVVRLKVLANLDLTEQRLPQDGKINLVVSGKKIDFRVSSLPGVHGENFVLRILDSQEGIPSLDNLGLDQKALQEIQLMLGRTTGIFLITGPTGSGKTTTLYSILNQLNSTEVNIMTLEDPVEYSMSQIRQTSINEAIGLDFARGVRALLRQDPDIILVGEIRDPETAEMAFRASMTGHQVFATLHTNSAFGALPRLADMGITKSILAGNITGILAQRLVRKLCESCKESYFPSEKEQRYLLGFSGELYRAKGCSKCNNTGYKGRIAVLEVARFTPEMDEALLAGAEIPQLVKLARNKGFTNLTENALTCLKAGETSFAEVARVINFLEIVSI